MQKAHCLFSGVLMLAPLRVERTANRIPDPAHPTHCAVPSGWWRGHRRTLHVTEAQRVLKTSVVVDNRSGAAGMIGTEIAIRATPDGYTLIAVEGGYAGNAAVLKLSFDPLRDVTPIAIIAETGFIVTMHPSVPAKTIRELIAYDKANPGKVHYGSGGTGSINHLVGELFNQIGRNQDDACFVQRRRPCAQ